MYFESVSVKMLIKMDVPITDGTPEAQSSVQELELWLLD